MPTTLQRWGNSLGIRLPKAVAEQLNFTTGTEVEFETTGGVLTVRPLRTRKHKLADLLVMAKGPSPHGRLLNDKPRGRELL
jgi:antitoxin MazE